MMLIDKIKALTQMLYPTGRAFRVTEDGDLYLLHQGLNQSEHEALTDAMSILDSILPDNDNFTEEDASAWEVRLGLITNDATPLADRKLAIIRKMNHPGTIKARQHYLYMQGQLQAAGFNVYVYENRFPTYPTGYTTKTPEQFALTPYPMVEIQHDYIFVQHGDVQHGETEGNKVANRINQTIDNYFNIGANYRSTFFIGGPYPGEFANVLASREQEFRQLIFKLKPAQTVGFLLINYI